MASVIWEIDSWSLAKQSGIYFSIACVTMLPIAYITNLSLIHILLELPMRFLLAAF